MIRSAYPDSSVRLPASAAASLENSPFGCIFEVDLATDHFKIRASGTSSARRPPIREARLMLAKDILQLYLDQMGDIVMHERFEDYCSRIQLPLSILTSSANLKINTLAELEDGFDEFTDMIHSLGVTDMVRTVKGAAFKGNDHIVGVYETRLMKQDRLALPRFHSKMWIGCYDGVWKAIRIHNTTKDTRWPMLMTRLASEPWLSEET
jgi:hypothetical protein